MSKTKQSSHYIWTSMCFWRYLSFQQLGSSAESSLKNENLLYFILLYLDLSLITKIINCPVDTGCNLNVHKMFRRRPWHLLNVLCTFNSRPVSTGLSFEDRCFPGDLKIAEFALFSRKTMTSVSDKACHFFM